MSLKDKTFDVQLIKIGVEIRKLQAYVLLQ